MAIFRSAGFRDDTLQIHNTAMPGGTNDHYQYKGIYIAISYLTEIQKRVRS